MLSTVLGVMLSMATTPAPGSHWNIPMYLVDDKGTAKPIGVVQVTEAKEGGLTLTPQLTGLPPGPHGFHVHENPSCAPLEKDGKKVAALGAGGHYDPKGAKKHEGPAGHGHLGDLPVLEVGADGVANKPLRAPRLTFADLRARSLVIHAGGDNYSDTPQALGGGGARIACGIVP